MTNKFTQFDEYLNYIKQNPVKSLLYIICTVFIVFIVGFLHTLGGNLAPHSELQTSSNTTSTTNADNLPCSPTIFEGHDNAQIIAVSSTINYRGVTPCPLVRLKNNASAYLSNTTENISK